jgi:hypothetical protein
MLMHEGERLERFRVSEQISRLWPVELRKSSEPFFQYERVIKNYFTAGIYQRQTDPYIWEDIDDLLTNTSLLRILLPVYWSRKIFGMISRSNSHGNTHLNVITRPRYDT